MYNQDLVEAVLKHADIVQVISAYIPVEKKGRNYVALCPFHDDKNPSMQISTEKQIFKCFVCGTGGNAISFVEKYEKIPFAAALRKVAKICNYDDPRLVEDAPKAPVSPALTKLYDCINDLQNYYRYALAIPEGEDARNYLASRDLGPEVQAKYGIGLDDSTVVDLIQSNTITKPASNGINVYNKSTAKKIVSNKITSGEGFGIAIYSNSSKTKLKSNKIKSCKRGSTNL
jgi:DNA primase catalytic core